MCLLFCLSWPGSIWLAADSQFYRAATRICLKYVLLAGTLLAYQPNAYTGTVGVGIQDGCCPGPPSLLHMIAELPFWALYMQGILQYVCIPPALLLPPSTPPISPAASSVLTDHIAQPQHGMACHGMRKDAAVVVPAAGLDHPPQAGATR